MEASFQSFIKAFGWSIVHSFWQGAIIYALLFLILISIPKLSPATKHNLSYLSICAIFTWFVATFIQLWQIPVQAPAYPFLSLENEFTVVTSNGWSFANIEILFPVILAIYLGGILVQSFILYRGYRVLQKLRKTNLEEVPANWTQLFYKVISKLDINKRIDFYISHIASVPMVIGYFKPVILFPASLITSLDTEQVEAILIHELTHIRRNDYLLNLIKTFIDTALFFNPFVFLTGRFIKIEREHICDDMVLKYTGQPVKYAETLLQIELDKSSPMPHAAMAAVNKKQYLFDRIKRMTNMKTNYMNVKQKLAGVTIVIAAVFCLAWLAPSKTNQGNEQKNDSEFSNKPSVIVNPKITGFNDHDMDTIIPSKKADVKIIVTDPDGEIKEYNSIKALPDSLKVDMGILQGRNFSFIGDSLLLHSKLIGKELKGILNDTAFLRGQREIAEQFNSLEFKENMKKAFQSFDSPEFKKEMEELKIQLNSGEFKEQQAELMQQWNFTKAKKQLAELQKQQAEMVVKLKKEQAQLIPKLKKEQVELIAKLKRQEADVIARMNSKEFNEGQRETIFKLGHRMPTLKLDGPDFTISGVDSLFFSGENKGNYRIYLESREKSKKDKELENNKQYQKLKKKFERDVEKLRKKQEQTESNK